MNKPEIPSTTRSCRLCNEEKIVPWPPQLNGGPTHHTCYPGEELETIIQEQQIHRIDCDQTNYDCVGCQLALAYEAIRILMTQRTNPQRDWEDCEEWEKAMKYAYAVLPEFKKQ